MLQAYSTAATFAANAAVPFNNVKIQKGCTAVLEAPATIALNKAGVYCVRCDAQPAAETTIQLYRDGVAQPETERTGTELGFETLVQVDKNNTNCCCSSPVRLQVVNTTATTGLINVVVTKIC